MTKQNQDKRSRAYKLGQSAVASDVWNFLLEALIFLPQGSKSGASCHKSPDDATDLLHKVYSEQ